VYSSTCLEYVYSSTSPFPEFKVSRSVSLPVVSSYQRSGAVGVGGSNFKVVRSVF
jgi:hypothetical protein